MKTLYNWLIDCKGYSLDEVHETIIRYNEGMDLPDSVLNDIKEYSYLFIESYSGSFV